MTAAALAWPRHIPFVEALGVTLWAYGEGHAELRLAPAAPHLNAWGVVHGGVLMTLLDVAMAHAARTAPAATDAPDNARGVATVEMKTSFVRPAVGPLRAFGGVLHRTATLAFCEARVLDAEDRLCAHATGTFKVLKALPATGRATHARSGPDDVLPRSGPDHVFPRSGPEHTTAEATHTTRGQQPPGDTAP